ncbi:MAG: Eco57I restriction-modification methylase domain-containing protein [Chloroflexi bacterium]|nr:Eco57I restriction-modification methylase domain-containing protein [Chloroflexota bacterium]MCY3684812.1 Eco57I restriction-modification methylase domain-containing protein [Chloroflexota bacterium]MDE2708642.1 Eco57I restriction-modification methylase domain-containing protein [Chloroflexota bacterium]
MADHQVTDRKAEINQALDACKDGDFHAGAKVLLGSLGYSSERTLAGQTGGVSDFFDAFQLDVPVTQSEAEFRDEAESAHLIFQITNEEIAAELQQSFFTESGLDKDEERSFLFVAVELRGDQYPRGKYAQFAREVNRRPHPPTVVLFRSTSGLVTLAFPHRRPSKRNGERDVLGKVSLVREIDPTKPHRGHIDILNELALEKRVEWMERQGRSQDFDGLYAAWLDTLDTEQLNKRFYKDLFRWFERACEVALFPSSGPRVLPSQEHVIRLITRLLFVWFIKEKGLVAEELFVEHRVGELLKDYDGKDGDSYYRAVLQNLFFATLNTEIGRRGFSSLRNRTHRDFSRYRYRDEIEDPEALLALFRQTPFINGGLFDCLDSEQGVRDGGWRIDCFTDNLAQRDGLSVPNRLFFGTEDKSPGLITLFNRYKFTVEENTPIEQEVALDPELLGKVFENLLAANTPETEVSARKQTGSYYTPRTVVDYMVDEALVASLLEQVNPTKGSEDVTKWWRDRLEYLFDYDDAFNDASELFTDDEGSSVVRAIARTTVLDPAVGSGAFPMSVLHKLTLALRRLDPGNEKWQELQKELALARVPAAFETRNQREREEELQGISDTFERYRDSDFGRKLYLIQNSIFGVDIQPIATQIAKLRFFISLAIEQEPDPSADNYGIKPLPNLETRFVAANALLGLAEGAQIPLGGLNEIQNLNEQLRATRERHFHANTRSKKLDLIARDTQLRHELRSELAKAGVSDAESIATWDPYDHNVRADWFDPIWMFGFGGGFDIVIGNPPYVRADSSPEHLALRNQIEASGQYETLWEKWDLFVAFIERGYKLSKPGGFTTMIVSDAYCHSKYAQKSQRWFLRNSRIVHLDFLSNIRIFEATVRNITFLFQKVEGLQEKPQRRVHDPEIGTFSLLKSNQQMNLTYRAFFPEDIAGIDIATPTLALRELCYISKGMVAHADEKRVRGAFRLHDLVSEVRSAIHCKLFVEGKHVARWTFLEDKWIEWGTDRAPALFSRPTFPELYSVSEKLLSADMAANTPALRVAYDNRQRHHNHSAWSFVPWHSLSGVRNRSMIKQARYEDERLAGSGKLDRHEAEATSRQIDVKFLLGVMNSSFARAFLRANRRSNIHLYPDDWKELPIPLASRERQQPVVALVDDILIAKANDPDAEATDLEVEIDRLVYSLYGLTEEEILVIEGRV